jgi:hypothetical protein
MSERLAHSLAPKSWYAKQSASSVRVATTRTNLARWLRKPSGKPNTLSTWRV